MNTVKRISQSKKHSLVKCFVTIAFITNPAVSLALDNPAQTNKIWTATVSRATEAWKAGNSQLAQDLYKQALTEIPSDLKKVEQAELFFKYGSALLLTNKSAGEEHLQKALKLAGDASSNLESNDKKNAQLRTEILTTLYENSLSSKDYSKALNYAEQLLPLKKSTQGEHPQYAAFLASYALALAQAGNKLAARKQIANAIEICEQENSIEEKRIGLAEALSAIANYYNQTRKYKFAEQYYEKAIYAGESLWFPLYRWTMTAMSSYREMLKATGKTSKANRLQKRLEEIDYTGGDPEGKDVCKFWNGEDAEMLPTTGGVAHIVKAQLDSRMPVWKDKSPKDIYATYLPK